MAKPRQGKSAGRRRPNAPDGARTESVLVVLSPHEKERIQALATRLGVSVPHLYEMSVWEGGAEQAAQIRLLRQELRATWRGLSTALNNINQMAHYANAEHHVHPETDAVRAQLVAVMDQVQDIASRVEGEVS